jgi:hypothetical protein
LGFPDADGPGQGEDFGDVGVVGAVRVEPGERPPGALGAGSGVDASEFFFGDPGGGEMSGGIAELDAGDQLGPAPFVEPSGAEESEPADPVERVVTASPMPEGVVLDPTTNSSPVRRCSARPP